jgi:hypothetical protein
MMPDVQEDASGLDPSVPHPARRYNYWLGGKDNFAADRESGDAVVAIFPSIRTAVIENRYFLRRAVSLLARELGIRQFLDIGTGLPTADNTHEVAQRTGAIPVYLRTHADVARFFDGLDVLDPGVVSISNWRAEHEPEPRPDESETATDCAVARIR